MNINKNEKHRVIDFTEVYQKGRKIPSSIYLDEERAKATECWKWIYDAGHLICDKCSAKAYDVYEFNHIHLCLICAEEIKNKTERLNTNYASYATWSNADMWKDDSFETINKISEISEIN